MLLAASGALFALLAAPNPELIVLDQFGRDITQRGITLLDWDGHIANPAIKLRLQLPPNLEFPADVHISGTSPMLHFDRSDLDDRTGIGKRIKLTSPSESVEFWVAVFPDRDGQDERHQLLIQLFSPSAQERSRMLLPVQVIDQDRPQTEAGYQIHADFMEDRTGFFFAPDVRRVMEQAATDWAYFIADPGYDPVQAENEQIDLWREDGFKVQRRVTIPHAYNGFYLYVSGIRHDEMRAGGAPSLCGRMHTLNGVPQPIRRSGSVEFDVRGNWNQLGWFVSRDSSDWWVSGSLRSEPSDLYSIAIHEIGHAVCYHGAYPRWGEAKRNWRFEDEKIRAYLGGDPRIDMSDHLPGTIDPISLYGAFGNEYHGRMKTRRWLLTKTHLLFLEAIGYQLRPTSALEALKVPERLALAVDRGQVVVATVEAQDGVPEYHFSVSGGQLPEGLALDSFTGRISGRTAQAGVHRFTVEVRDQDPTSPPVRSEITLTVRS